MKMCRLTMEDDRGMCMGIDGEVCCPDGNCPDECLQERIGKLWDYEAIGTVEKLTALVQAESEGRLVELPKDINAEIWYHYNAGVWSGKSKDAMLPVIKRGVRRFYSSMEECEAAEAALAAKEEK